MVQEIEDDNTLLNRRLQDRMLYHKSLRAWGA